MRQSRRCRRGRAGRARDGARTARGGPDDARQRAAHRAELGSRALFSALRLGISALAVGDGRVWRVDRRPFPPRARGRARPLPWDQTGPGMRIPGPYRAIFGREQVFRVSAHSIHTPTTFYWFSLREQEQPCLEAPLETDAVLAAQPSRLLAPCASPAPRTTFSATSRSSLAASRSARACRSCRAS